MRNERPRGRKFLLAVCFALAFVFMLAKADSASAATCTWTAASSTNMSNIDNWSGAGCTLAATDDLVFDDTTTTNAVWDTSSTFANVTISAGYGTGSISVSNEVQATVTGVFSIVGAMGGTVELGTDSVLILSGSGTPFTIADGGTQFSGGNGTVKYTATSGSVNVVTSSAIGTLFIDGNGGTFNLPNLTLRTLRVDNGTVNCGGSTINFQNASVTPLSLNGGTFNTNISTINYIVSSAVNISATSSYYNLAIDGGMLLESNTSTFLGNLTVNNNFTVSGLPAGGSYVVDMGSYNLSVGGNITVNDLVSFNHTSGAVTLTGASKTVTSAISTLSFYNLTVSGSASLNATTTIANNLTISGSGSLDLTSSKVTVAGNLSNSAGTITDTNATVTMSSLSEKTLGGASGNTTISNLVISGTVAMSGSVTSTAVTISGTLSAGADNTLVLTGSGVPLLLSGGSFYANTSTVVYAGSSANIATTTYYNLTIDATGVALAGNATTTNYFSVNSGKDFTQSSGTMVMTGASGRLGGAGNTSLFELSIPSGASVTLYGNVTSTATTTIASGGTLLGSNKTLVLSGSNTPFQVAGTFTANTSNVSYTNATVNVTGAEYYNLTIESTAATLTANATTTSNLTINEGATLNMQGYDFSVGNNLVNSGSVTQSAGTVTITGSGGVVNALGLSTVFYDLHFSQTGSVGGNVTTTNDLIIDSGRTVAFSTGSSIVIGRHLNNSGIVTPNDSTVTMIGEGNLGNAAGTTELATLIINSGANVTMVDDISVSSTITVAGTLNAGTKTLTLSGSGTPLAIAGTFNANTSTVSYSNPGSVTTAAANYYNLTLGTGTYALGGNINVSSTLTLGAGTLNASDKTVTLVGSGTPFANSGTLNAGTSNFNYTNTGTVTTTGGVTYSTLTLGNGTYTLSDNVTSTAITLGATGTFSPGARRIELTGTGTTPLTLNGGTFTYGTSEVVYSGASATIASTTYYNLTANCGTACTLGGHTTSTNDVVVNASKNLALSTYNLNIGRHFTNSGTVTQTSGTVTMSGTGNLGGSGSTQLAALAISGTVTLNGNVTSTATTTISGTFTGSDSTARTLTLSGSGTPLVITGTFTPATSTIVYSGSSATNLTSAIYYNLTVNTAGTLAGNVTTTNVLTISSDKSLDAGAYTIVLSGSGTPFVKTGTFTASTSNFNYTNTGTVTTTGAAYYNLTLDSGTYNLADNATTTGAFINGGTLTIASGKTLIASGTFDNNGTITETGAIKHANALVKLTDSSGTEVGNYGSGSDLVYVKVQDVDGNLDVNAQDTITGSVVVASGYSDSEAVTLTETGNDTGIFINTTGLALNIAAAASNNSGGFQVSGNGQLTLTYTDSKDSSDTGTDLSTFTGSAYVAPGGGGSSSGGTPSAPSLPAGPASAASNAQATTEVVLSMNVATPVSIGGVAHSVTVSSASATQITITIRSNPVTLTLKEGETKDLDTDADKIKDLRVSYLGLVANKPKLAFVNLTDVAELKKALTINNGAYETNSREVVVALSVTDAAQVALSNTSDFANASYVTYASTMQWTLAEGNGLKTVYAKFRTKDGGTATASDTITLVSGTGSASPITVSPTPSPAKTVKSKYKFTKTLNVGATGTAVKELQSLLKELGYYTAKTITGKYDAATKAAVVKFQKAKDLKPYPGWVGPGTITELNKLTQVKSTEAAPAVSESKTVKSKYKFTKTLNVGATGTAVKELQSLLKELGYYTAKTITGKYDAATKAAVVKFQKGKDLKPYPGWVGPGTLKALNSL